MLPVLVLTVAIMCLRRYTKLRRNKALHAREPSAMLCFIVDPLLFPSSFTLSLDLLSIPTDDNSTTVQLNGSLSTGLC